MGDFNSDLYQPRWLFVLVAVAGLAVAGVIILAAWPAKAEPAPCMDTETREHVRGLMLTGIDDALKRHARRMFDGWMKDPANQPRRAAAGLNTAISAHAKSRAAAQRWNPPACER
jgi:2-phospho-L-lactate guanylyltransferase (CobY/MobA/RfbA family)